MLISFDLHAHGLQASTSARDESDSYMADGDAHDTSMERNSGVVAASALRLYERSTLPLQHVDTSIPGANSLDVLSELEVGPNVHVVSPTRALTGRFRAKATAQQEDAGSQSPTKVRSQLVLECRHRASCPVVA